VLGALSLLKELLFFVSYISNSSFPEPLTQEEEKKYLQEYLTGSEEAKNKLIEHNMRLVAHIAKKYTNIGISNEDVISIGMIGLIKGVSTYNGEKGKLATYIARCAENEILMQIRSNKKLKNEVMLDDPIGLDKEGNFIRLYDILGTKSTLVSDEVETRLQLEKLTHLIYDSLTDRERFVVELRYGLKGGRSVTQREIAKMLGISRSYVSRIEKKALSKLNRKLFNG
jgi:RNA polymerase sporulation-specific sigma factor